jgi:phosphatidate phosphatase APP1
VAPDTQAFKLNQISRILDTFPHLKFICIGDSGQHDPEVYRQIVEQYPGRILGVYIRDVSEASRDAEVTRITEEVKQKGTEMLLLGETLSAARHAFGMKWINADQLADVEAECKRDDQPGEPEH